MKIRYLVLGPILAAGLVFGAGCGSDDDDDDGGTAGTSSAGTGGSSAGTGGTTSGGSGGSGGTGGSASGGECTLASDAPQDACVGFEDAYSAEYDGKTMNDLAGDCGRESCIGQLGQPGFKECVRDCIMETTGDALPGDCVFCVAITVECGGTACISDCLVDTGNCEPCLCDEGAYDSLETCTGIPSTTDCSAVE